jgi:hypothetical protein
MRREMAGCRGKVGYKADRILILSYTGAMTGRRRDQSLAVVLRKIKTQQRIPIETIPLAALPKPIIQKSMRARRRKTAKTSE